MLNGFSKNVLMIAVKMKMNFYLEIGIWKIYWNFSQG